MRPPAVRPSAAIAGVMLVAGALAGCSAIPGAAPTGVKSENGPQGHPSSTPTSTIGILPVLTVASVDVDGKHVTASGYVQGVIRDGGVCTFTFSHDGSSAVTVKHDAVADRSTTSCGAVQPDIALFTRGTWHVTLEYVSDGEEYTSTPLTLEVP